MTGPQEEPRLPDLELADEIPLFDLPPEQMASLSEDERMVLLRLLVAGQISEEQASQVLDLATRNRTPLLDILGSYGMVRPLEYARNLAGASQAGMATRLIGTDALALDEDLVRRFRPGDLVRFLFCPINQSGGLVVVLAVDPAEPAIERLVHEVVPDAEVIAMVGTEIDVTRLVDRVFQPQLSWRAVNLLRSIRPLESASRVFSKGQAVVLAVLSVLLVAALVADFWLTAALMIAAISLFYSTSVLYKLIIALAGSRDVALDHITADDLAAMDAADLPVYSVLVPVYREPKVVPTLLAGLARMDYPREKLDVLLLMEEDDHETIEAARAANPPSFFRFILIPESLPRTKPKACNYGLTFCRGEFVTIYDAEDIPEPDQLKRAVLAFRRGDPNLVCVQAALNYFNSDENYLTRMFTLEYSYWFDYMLPGLDQLKLPIPLGGTSNHFRLDRLRELGGWDPFNVTEDADLGIRSSARGYTVGIIQSTTWEEANREPRNWIRQRSRWIKGYMQTWLVHNRRPLAVLRSVGPKAWLSYQYFIGGTCAIFLINPVLWGLFLVWLVGLWFEWPAWNERLFTGWWLVFAATNLIIGNLLGIYLNMLAVFRRRQFHLTVWAITNPVYWFMHSIASYMALWQLVTKPFYWEKTNHGLTTVDAEELAAQAAAGVAPGAKP